MLRSSRYVHIRSVTRSAPCIFTRAIRKCGDVTKRPPATEQTLVHRVGDAGIGLVAGGAVGCGFGSPFGSFLGLFIETASGGSGIGGFLNGALLGGISGGGLGGALGVGIGLSGGRAALLRPNTLAVGGRARIGGAILDKIPLEPYADSLLNTLPFRGRLLCFIFGLVLGSGGFSFVLTQWRWEKLGPNGVQDLQPEFDVNVVTFSGILQRWVWCSRSCWWPHWEQTEAQIRSGFLLLHPGHDPTAAAGDPNGISLAVPLADLKMQRTASGLALTTSSDEHQFLRITDEHRDLWEAALKGALTTSMRFVDVSVPAEWEPPFDKPRLSKLKATDAEYQRVARAAESQQFIPRRGHQPYVKGKLKVTGVSRVQSPHVWYQYSMRRAIIAQENDGDPNEQELWHGTPNVDIIIKQGFDPRVCSLRGMFGAGVYFADKSTKSVRYCGNLKRGQLILCRVSMGRPMLKRLSCPNLRRPPEPSPIYPTHVTTWLRGQVFHSLFYSSDFFPYALLMSEYIVYHSNQAYPEYVVDFEMH